MNGRQPGDDGIGNCTGPGDSKPEPQSHDNGHGNRLCARHRGEARRMKLIVLADLHYCAEAWRDDRYWSVANVLLERAVRRINHTMQTDLVLVLGDVLADGRAADASDLLFEVKSILDRLFCPYLAIPGNHDDAEVFAKVFGPLPDFYDFAGVRFVPFIDLEEPNWNARRTERDLARLQSARNGHDGPLVCLQHTSLFPPHSCECPFNFVNAEEVIDQMRRLRVSLSISGHFHQGVTRIDSGDMVFCICPALCEMPFEFLEM